MQKRKKEESVNFIRVVCLGAGYEYNFFLYLTSVSSSFNLTIHNLFSEKLYK